MRQRASGAARRRAAERPASTNGADREIDEEHPAPAGPSVSTPAEEDAGAEARPAVRAPGAERLVPVAALAEGGREDRERRGHHHRRADPLREAGARSACPRSGRGRRASDASANTTCPATSTPSAADQVGRAPAEQHEAAVRQQVAAQHPLQALHGEVQVAPDRRQGDVDDRGVDEVEEGDAAQEGERQSAATAREERLGRVCLGCYWLVS